MEQAVAEAAVRMTLLAAGSIEEEIMTALRLSRDSVVLVIETPAIVR
jgi:hypothetical protein